MNLARVSPWLALTLLGACSLTQPTPAPVVEAGAAQNLSVTHYQSEQLLITGLKQYDQGQYKRASSTLQQAIDNGLVPKSEILAHKHLAFIHCISNRINDCRSEFGKAVAIDPSFELAPAEIGHPQWGPAFRSVKAIK
jgi:Tfp pilus assembly protein PilF